MVQVFWWKYLMYTVWSHVTWSGLEIPFEVTMNLADTEKNRLALTKYEAITAERYEEPVDGEYWIELK